MDSHNMQKTLAYNSTNTTRQGSPSIPGRIFNKVAGFDGHGGYHGLGGHGGNQLGPKSLNP